MCTVMSADANAFNLSFMGVSLSRTVSEKLILLSEFTEFCLGVRVSRALFLSAKFTPTFMNESADTDCNRGTRSRVPHS